MDEYPSFEQVLDAEEKVTQIEYMHWIKNEVFTFQFWLLVAMLIVPWIIWWKLVDKKKFLEISIYGLLVITVVTFLDEVGCQLNLWEYRFDIEPLFPRLIPMNFAMFPVGYTLVYQYFPKWKSFIIANIVTGALFAFVGEPIFIAIKIYVLLGWKHIYSFPIYIVIAIALKALTQLIMKIHRRALS